MKCFRCNDSGRIRSGPGGVFEPCTCRRTWAIDQLVQASQTAIAVLQEVAVRTESALVMDAAKIALHRLRSAVADAGRAR